MPLYVANRFGQLQVRPLLKDFSIDLWRPDSVRNLRQLVRSNALDAAPLKIRSGVLGRTPALCEPLLGGKGSVVPRRRTANLLARADKQSMDNSTFVSTNKQDKQILTLPTILTLLRVASIPVLIGVWFSNLSSASIICSGVFVTACLTDYLDGYLARKLNSTSAFGAFLDPVADKLMVATVLILLASEPMNGGPWAGNIWLLPSLSSAIIGREITMSALREWAASCSPEAHQAVAVSSWGKWKTATQATPHHLRFCSAVLHADLAWLFLIRLRACRAVVLSGSSTSAIH
ncbi:hypothetical protein ABBQ32_009540 [Trebouxia sp. C0010 RCD-2024]